jgi:DNA/RNA-binding domain of Phe-tRNA-synthetase-like protein
MEIQVQLPDAEFLAGVLIARGVGVAPSPPALARQIDELLSQRAGEAFPPPPLKEAIRDMLRKGGYRPAGRSKPASEYLAQAAREGRFPRINNLVDSINLLSLKSGLPISLLDLGAVGQAAQIRYGRDGERYVFNAGGQEIDLAGLVCICRAEGGADMFGIPLGTPIKDSMAGKVNDHTTSVLAVIYGSSRVVDQPAMEVLLAELGRLLEEHGEAHEIERHVLRGGADAG